MAKINSRISLLNSYSSNEKQIDFEKLLPLDDEELDSWWRTVPGARRFTNVAMDSAAKNLSAAFHLSKVDAEGFIQTFQEKIQRRYFSSIVEVFEYGGSEDIEDFVSALTERFSPNFLRDFTKDSPMSDIAEQNLFSGYIIIVKLENKIDNLPEEIAEFNKASKGQSGSLIFVSSEENPPPSMTRFSDFLTPYDVQFFAINLLDNARLSPPEKIYTATLTAKLAGHSPILAKNLATAELFTDGEKFARKIIPDFDERIFSRAVWECQVQYLLPILEQVRGRLIEKNFRQLRSLLPVKDEFGKIITDPWDMELRHLHFYGGSARIFQLNEWENLELVYSARNFISHLEVIERNDVEKILTLAD